MKLLFALEAALDTVRELARELWGRPRYRRFILLLPVFVLLSALMALIGSAGVLAPFVYPLF